jgi:hypothetical protein
MQNKFSFYMQGDEGGGKKKKEEKRERLPGLGSVVDGLAGHDGRLT